MHILPIGKKIDLFVNIVYRFLGPRDIVVETETIPQKKRPAQTEQWFEDLVVEPAGLVELEILITQKFYLLWLKVDCKDRLLHKHYLERPFVIRNKTVLDGIMRGKAE